MIFILGGRGLVGSAFTRYCEARGLPHRVVDRQSYPELKGLACELFVNANGNSRKPLAIRDPMADFDASVRSVRASLVDFKFDRYVHLSSCDVYEDCSSPEATGEDRMVNVARVSPYGFHKLLAEACVRHVAKSWLVFRMGGFVGPGLKKGPIFDIQQGGPLWLDKESELQFLHTDVAAGIVMELCGRGVTDDVINLCGRGTVRLAELIGTSDISVHEGSPCVRYDVSIEKLLKMVDVPESRGAAKAFLGVE